MMGMRLLDMEACDALDVIHVLLEEDIIVRSPEEHDSRRHVRNIIYGSMYKMQNSETRYRSVDRPVTADGTNAPAVVQTTKPYIPPSDPAQLSAVLGPPMG